MFKWIHYYDWEIRNLIQRFLQLWGIPGDVDASEVSSDIACEETSSDILNNLLIY